MKSQNTIQRGSLYFSTVVLYKNYGSRICSSLQNILKQNSMVSTTGSHWQLQWDWFSWLSSVEFY